MVPVAMRREPRFVYLCDAEPAVRGKRPSATDIRIGWRLDAANHRPLGRGTTLFDSAETTRGALCDVRARAAEAVVSFTPRPGAGLWTWRLDLDGIAVAVSAHSFPRRIECARAYTQFRAALDVADPMLGVVRNFGSRALRSFETEAGAR